jgi:hypothetical protein
MRGSGEKAYDKKKIIVVKILLRGKSEKNFWNKQAFLIKSHDYVVATGRKNSEFRILEFGI